jgi:hypothetical protein
MRKTACDVRGIVFFDNRPSQVALWAGGFCILLPNQKYERFGSLEKNIKLNYVTISTV